MKIRLFLIILIFSSLIYADIYKEEDKKIKSDRKRITEIEKKLAADEKECNSAPQQNLDRNVISELKIYCEARESAKSRIPALKTLLDEYESTLNNYLQECKTVNDDETYSKCENLDRQTANAAENLNNEKENFNSDIDTMENAAAKAKELNERNNDANRQDFIRTVSNNLQAKKELVTAMKKGLAEDKKTFQNSKKQLTNSLKSSSGETAARGSAFLEKLNGTLLQNGALDRLCDSMLQAINEAKNVCISKIDMKKCNASETKMENLFNDGNEKLTIYKDEKSALVSLENEYSKAGMGDILTRTENAQKTITAYLKGLKEQNSYLRQQIEMSANNMEVVKSRNNKKLLDTYSALVTRAKELEKENSDHTLFYEENINKINNFTTSCIQGKTELTAECRIEGEKITEAINSHEPKITKYGGNFNKLAGDFDDFYKKFK